ncbi:MAG: efflux RND transporter periplasmic adaptor subunit [Candidatus Omnitrophota bacterium]
MRVILILAMAMVLGCSQKEAAKPTSAAIIPVRTQKVETKDLYELLEYVGNIKAREEAVVYPKVSGKIIEKVKEDGSPVNKGEVILFIDRDEVGLKFEKAPVESPIKGVVGRVYVDIGTNVTAQTAVALVVDMEKVKIDLDIPEKYLPQVSHGQQALISVDAYPHQEFSGTVTKISPVLDLPTRTAPIEITVDNPDYQLKSGMFARVKLRLKEHKAVPVVLKEAVLGKDHYVYVFVVENNTALLKKVNLGIRQGDLFEIREGIKPGQAVVIMGQQGLYDQAKVSEAK